MKLIAFYKKQDIKTKLFILLFTLIFVVSGISLAAMNISFSLYDDILLNESAEVTALYSATIEHEIKNIELLTYKILSDPKIQSGLKTINTLKSSYEKYNALESVKERLMAQAQTERYITSISLITLDLEEHASGANVIYLEETLKNELIESSKSKEGAIIWRSVFPNEKTIIAAEKSDLQKICLLLQY